MISLQIWDRRGAAFGEDPYVTPIVRQSHFNGKHHLAGPVGLHSIPENSVSFTILRLALATPLMDRCAVEHTTLSRAQ